MFEVIADYLTLVGYKIQGASPAKANPRSPRSELNSFVAVSSKIDNLKYSFYPLTVAE